MKKTAPIFLILFLLAVLTTFVTFAEKKADAPAQTAAVEEIALADLNLDAQADTLGGSDGGAPCLGADELAAFVFDVGETAAVDAEANAN